MMLRQSDHLHQLHSLTRSSTGTLRSLQACEQGLLIELATLNLNLTDVRRWITHYQRQATVLLVEDTRARVLANQEAIKALKTALETDPENWSHILQILALEEVVIK